MKKSEIYSVAEHMSQSAHSTWNFVCSCDKCEGYIIKVKKSDVPVILARMGLNDYLTVEQWNSLNHNLVLPMKIKSGWRCAK